MFNKIKSWIANCIKTSNELDKSTNELNNVSEQNICKFESDTSDCSLIQELKSKQEIKKIVDDDIKEYDSHGNDNIQKFLNFLITMENSGFRMNVSSRIWSDVSDIRDMFNREGTFRLEVVLDSFSLDDIDDIANEIKALKQKMIIVKEKRAYSNALAKDISDIKVKLGID